MLVRAAKRLIAVLGMGLALGAPAAAQVPIPFDYPESYGGLELALRGKSPEQRAKEEAAANTAESACDKGDLAGCAALGRAFLYGEGRPQNRPVAELLLRQACDGAEGAGCHGLGVLLQTVDEPALIDEGALALARGCRLGDLEACAENANVIERGPSGFGGDLEAATALRRTTCAKGGGSACRELGKTLARSDDPAARDEGRELLVRQCRAGDADACGYVVNQLKPIGALARELTSLGCDAGEPYLCRELGDLLFAETSGPPESRTAALAKFDRACAFESMFCYLSEQIRARPALVESCGRGVQTDCVALGRLYSTGPGSPLHSPAEAMTLLGTACETGVIEACSAAAGVIINGNTEAAPEIAARMVRWREIGCAGGSTNDCTALAKGLLTGDPFPSDRQRGYALFTQLCDAGEGEACQQLEQFTHDDPEAPLLAADFRNTPPLTAEEQAERDRKEEEARERQRAEDRARSCASSEVAFRGAVYADTICFSVLRVIRGFAVRPGEAPWQALLWRPAQMNGRSLSARERVECGGSLIREGWILTAAHCVVDKNKKPLVGKEHRIRLGVHSPGEEEGISYPILRAIPHPSYHEKSRAFDIALIQIDGRAASRSAYPGKIARIRLDPLPLGQRPIRAGMPVYTFGWGREEVAGQASDVLKGAKMQLEDPAACTARTRFRGELLQDALLCAGAADRSQACNGDSGGPLVTYADADKVPTVIGVVSAGTECGTTGVPSRYTRVAKVRGWIDDVIAGKPPEARRRQ